MTLLDCVSVANMRQSDHKTIDTRDVEYSGDNV